MQWKQVGLTAALVLSGVLASNVVASEHTRLVYSGNTTCRDIALTYDVEFSGTTQSLLDTLDNLDVRSTWFFVGRDVGRYPDLVRQVAARHQIGNHSYDHSSMTTLSDNGRSRQVTSTEAAIERVTGKAPAKLFRPPYGDWDSRVLSAVAEHDYRYMVMWTIDTLDWERPTAQTIRDRIINQAFPGAIVLMHGFVPQTPAATQMAVADLRQRGYQFLTVTEILGDDRDQRDFAGETYVVQPGDTPEYIARCHNVDAARLMAFNRISRLTAGQELRIPMKNEIVIELDGEVVELRTPARVIDGRSVAHIRLVEEMGATVYWLGGEAVIVKGNQFIAVRPGSRQAMINRQPVDMGAEAVNIDGSVMVPVRFLAEQLGLSVQWDQATLTVKLQSR